MCIRDRFNRPITLRNKNYHVRLLAPKPGRPVIFRWQDDTPYRALSNILKKSADNDPRSAAHGDLLAALDVPVYALTCTPDRAAVDCLKAELEHETA